MNMEKDAFLNLAERTAAAFPEIDSDICTDLFKNDGEYAALRKEADQLQQAHPFIMEIMEGGGAVSLSETEHGAFVQYLGLMKQIEDAERQGIYFRGHTDCFAYLKKIGAI
jgi:hypothetical protein